ncbi:MAG: hypothetical protein IPL78_16570 [Chloroflexi bacterium]|nr:hypothetical protein [Chloroflexota bacterium]
MQRRAFWGMFWLWLLVACQTNQPPTATSTPTLNSYTTFPAATVMFSGVPAAATSLTPQPAFSSPAYGIHLAQWWHLDALQQDLRRVQEMGFGWVKQKFAWRDIEPAVKGHYDWYRPDEIVNQVNQAGLNLLVRLDVNPAWVIEALPDELWGQNQPPVNYQDFGDFCYATAERYRGRIQAYQVWNEPNLSREWGNQSPNPREYTELLRVCYLGIKTADPAAIVVSAGLAPTGTQPLAMPDTDFLQGMYDAGAAAYFDVLGINAPGYKAPPETDPAVTADPANGYGGHRWNAFRHVEDIRAIMVANGDEAKQVAILEMGWMREQTVFPDYQWHGVTEEQQAEYLVGAYEYAREHWQPWIGLMTTIYIADHDWQAETNEQYWWSIILPDGTRTLAYEALREMEK